uniref:F-box domain-containing protein n=1 Tax=Mycena chlorophos TaxID=658473 RepID=A0ABQ0M2N6_MYCCL|nr:predicted protein [Mycena chlorophos]
MSSALSMSVAVHYSLHLSPTAMSRFMNWARGHRTTSPLSLSVFPTLPTELILEVLSVADNSTLHTLALVSRRFNELAKDTLLRRHGIDLSSRTASVSSSEALYALRLVLASPPATSTQTPAKLDTFEAFRGCRHPASVKFGLNERAITVDPYYGGFGEPKREYGAALRLVRYGYDRTVPYRIPYPTVTVPIPTRDGLSNGGLTNIRSLRALFDHSTRTNCRIANISITFQYNLIERPLSTRMSIAAPNLLYSLCGDSPVVVIVANGAIFTHNARSMRSWAAYSIGPHIKWKMHDGSKQWVPAITSILTLEAHYPLGSGKSSAWAAGPPSRPRLIESNPSSPWTLLCVNSSSITTLHLAVELDISAWTLILCDPALVLPMLDTVHVYTKNITPRASVEFLNRHSRTLTSLSYMVSVDHAARNDNVTVPGTFPKLEKLIANALYVDALLGGTTSAGPAEESNFPALRELEIWPSEAPTPALPRALHAAAAHLPALDTLSLHYLTNRDLPQGSDATAHGEWPRFAAVHTVLLISSTAPPRPDVPRLAEAILWGFPKLSSLQVQANAGGPGDDPGNDQQFREWYEQFREGLANRGIAVDV